MDTHRTRISSVRALAGVFAFASLGACAPPPAVNLTATPRVLTLRGVGTVEVAPDEAYLTLYLNCEERSARAAANCVREQAAELHAALGRLGVDSTDRQTQSLRLDKRYHWNGRDNRFVGYTASTSLGVTLRDVERLEDMYDRLLDDQRVTLGELRYGHSAVDSLARAAHLRALDEAGALARDLLTHAGAGGAEPRVVAMRNSPVSSSVPQGGLAGMDAMRVREEAIEVQAASPTGNFASATGLITVRAQLWVDYAVE